MSANNVIWIMKYMKKWHVWYSACADNIPEKPNYDHRTYKKFINRKNAIVYAFDLEKELTFVDKETGQYHYVEYGVCEV